MENSPTIISRAPDPLHQRCGLKAPCCSLDVLLSRFPHRDKRLDTLLHTIFEADSPAAKETGTAELPGGHLRRLQCDKRSRVTCLLFGKDTYKHPCPSTIPDEDKGPEDRDEDRAYWSVHCLLNFQRTKDVSIGWLSALADMREKLTDNAPLWVADVGCGSATIWGVIAALADPHVRVESFECGHRASVFAKSVVDRYALGERIEIHEKDVLELKCAPRYHLVISETIGPGLLNGEPFIQISNIFKDALLPGGKILPESVTPRVGIVTLQEWKNQSRDELVKELAPIAKVCAGDSAHNMAPLTYRVDLKMLKQGISGCIGNTHLQVYGDLWSVEPNNVTSLFNLLWFERSGDSFFYSSHIDRLEPTTLRYAKLFPREARYVTLSWLPGAMYPTVLVSDVDERVVTSIG
jgi:hypothetical protein